MKNWKTTSTGITMVVAGVFGGYIAFKNNQLNEATVSGCITSVLGGIGLIFAKDNNVTGGTVINEPNDASTVKKSTKLDQ